MSEPSLTMLEQPIREMGRRAAHLLVERLGVVLPGQSTLPVEHVRLDTRLVTRGTTAPPS